MGCCNNSRNNGRNNNVSPIQEKMIVHPTQRVRNVTTNRSVVRNVYPTEVVNVNRNVVRSENYYPVSNSDVNETVVEQYDCGSDMNSPNCQRVSPASTNNGNSNNNGSRGRSRKKCHRNDGWSWI
ncbi:spore coat protein [Gracilibacillus caseinilyticus]|uniref:Spore coat protein n=1 Tax=Gracilibacillus caseinilyticus TaxID=2932256 RepID=A0ABY4EX07_9BACI|nr:CotD family spore coat protein [Gracilibacillus caseinilyticus]UOQ48953.1 spore coat protein [Gracilibacillus caseinilyticus]